MMTESRHILILGTQNSDEIAKILEQVPGLEVIGEGGEDIEIQSIAEKVTDIGLPTKAEIHEDKMERIRKRRRR